MSDHEIPVPDELVLNYHLMHPVSDSDAGDPNAAYCLDGIYHMHYIVIHPWGGREHIGGGKSLSFIHVTSPDMLHWTWQPTKLQPSFTGHGVASGTGFMTREGRPAALYAGLADQNISYITIAKDNQLSAWEEPYPVIVTGGPDGDMPRPVGCDCFLSGDTYYAYSKVENVPLCKSTDLKDWTYVGPLLKHELPQVAMGEDIGCPNMFQLGERWMLLCISHAMGCRYYLGDWDRDAEQFVPESHGRMSWRRPDQSLTDPRYRDFFAPESLLTADGRRVMWAWVASADPAINMKKVQSLPRELSLADGELRMNPLRELESLRYDPVSLENIVLAPPEGAGTGKRYLTTKLADLDGDGFELRISIDRREAERKRFGFTLFAGSEGEGMLVLFRPESGTICVGDSEAPFAVADLPGGENIDLRVFIDKYLVEVFVNSRQALLSTYMDHHESTALEAYLYGIAERVPPMTIRKIEIWRLNPTNQGFLEARENRIWAPDIE